MELTTLYKQYRAAKMAADQAAKEEDKLKKALKKAMEEAGVKNYTDEDGFLFERIVQNRKSMDETDSTIIWMPPSIILWAKTKTAQPVSVTIILIWMTKTSFVTMNH